MRKQILRGLALCLAALAVTGTAWAAAPDKQVAFSEPIIVYDGTVLYVTLGAVTASSGISLLEVDLLHPDLHGEREVQQAIAAGGKLTGVYTYATLFAGDTEFSTPRLFQSGEGGRKMSKGFIFVLPPEAPRENLFVKASTELWKSIDGPVLDRAEAEVALPEPLHAETVFIPADISLLEVLPNNMGLIMDEPSPDRSQLSGVFISSSEEAFCLLLHLDGDAEYEAVLTNAVSGEPFTYSFSLNNSWPPRDADWAYFVFDPVPEMPQKLSLTINHPSLSRETATLEIDIVAGTVTLV